MGAGEACRKGRDKKNKRQEEIETDSDRDRQEHREIKMEHHRLYPVNSLLVRRV